MSSILASFDNFSSTEEKVEFLNELLQKQIELSYQLCESHPNNEGFHRHLQMLIKVKDFNFTTELAKKLFGELTIAQFSKASADLLNELLDSYLTIFFFNLATKKQQQQQEVTMSFDETKPLVLKIYEPSSNGKKYPPLQPFHDRCLPTHQATSFPFVQVMDASTLTTSPLFRPPPRISPTEGERFWEGIFEDKEKVLNKLIFGEYSSLSDMATDINGCHKSELVEKILYKQMRRLLKENLKSLLRK